MSAFEVPSSVNNSAKLFEIMTDLQIKLSSNIKKFCDEDDVVKAFNIWNQMEDTDFAETFITLSTQNMCEGRDGILANKFFNMLTGEKQRSLMEHIKRNKRIEFNNFKKKFFINYHEQLKDVERSKDAERSKEVENDANSVIPSTMVAYSHITTKRKLNNPEEFEDPFDSFRFGQSGLFFYYLNEDSSSLLDFINNYTNLNLTEKNYNTHKSFFGHNASLFSRNNKYVFISFKFTVEMITYTWVSKIYDTQNLIINPSEFIFMIKFFSQKSRISIDHLTLYAINITKYNNNNNKNKNRKSTDYTSYNELHEMDYVVYPFSVIGSNDTHYGPVTSNILNFDQLSSIQNIRIINSYSYYKHANNQIIEMTTDELFKALLKGSFEKQLLGGKISKTQRKTKRKIQRSKRRKHRSQKKH